MTDLLIGAGVSQNSIIMLLLLPVIATVIAAVRQIVGIRGFGIFLPAALAMSFLAIGPILGILLFILIALVSTTVRVISRKLKLKLQYLPKMAIILWFVSISILGVLFIYPQNVSIFPVFILILLTEDFTRIQIGKSIKTAINLTFQTLILALVSYAVLTYKPLQEFVLLNPEVSLAGVFLINIILGRFVGLRFTEYLRFRKFIKS